MQSLSIFHFFAMTRAQRLDTGKTVGCFPQDTLADSLAKLIDPDHDGVPANVKIIGKMSLPGDMERPVEKFSGREFEVWVSICILLFHALNKFAQVTVAKDDTSKVIRVKITNA